MRAKMGEQLFKMTSKWVVWACVNILFVLFLSLCKFLKQLLSSSTMSDDESEWELSEETRSVDDFGK